MPAYLLDSSWAPLYQPQGFRPSLDFMLHAPKLSIGGGLDRGSNLVSSQPPLPVVGLDAAS